MFCLKCVLVVFFFKIKATWYHDVFKCSEIPIQSPIFVTGSSIQYVFFNIHLVSGISQDIDMVKTIQLYRYGTNDSIHSGVTCLLAVLYNTDLVYKKPTLSLCPTEYIL